MREMKKAREGRLKGRDSKCRYTYRNRSKRKLWKRSVKRKRKERMEKRGEREKREIKRKG